MNKHIEVVKKWLADNGSVDAAELKANYAAADAVAYDSYESAVRADWAPVYAAVYAVHEVAADAAFAATNAANKRAKAKKDEDAALIEVRKYKELTGE